jgi:hypothetical protein
VDVRWFETGKGQLLLRYIVQGVDALAVPAFAGKGRGDDLWRTTCFELFLKDADGAGYGEFNFSPSERWAAYRFDDYRSGGKDAEPRTLPEVTGSGGSFTYVLTATLEMRELDGAVAVGLSAVIEEKDGTKSYWALAHGPGQPDFHYPACFALPLPAPVGP